MAHRATDSRTSIPTSTIRNGTLIDTSASFSWNTEWVEWTYDGTRGPYSVQIRPYSWSCYLAQEKIGWAWVPWSTP
jgi:hypothetical protein